MNGTLMSFDVGTKRIGVAIAHESPRIAFGITTLEQGDATIQQLEHLIHQYAPEGFVIGLPRHQSGEESEQADYSRQWAERYLVPYDKPIVYHDESTTSVLARERLDASTQPYERAAVDMMAAQIILESYLEHTGANA
jgi:putative Holliday junction resolvase